MGPAQTTAGKAGTAPRTNQLRHVFAVLLSHHEEGHKAICSNTDGSRDDHTKGTKSEKQMLYNITYMWDLKYNTDELTHKTGTDLQTEKADLLLPGHGVGEGRAGTRGLAGANY